MIRNQFGSTPLKVCNEIKYRSALHHAIGILNIHTGTTNHKNLILCLVSRQLRMLNIIRIMPNGLQAMLCVMHNFHQFLLFLALGIDMTDITKTTTEKTKINANNVFIVIITFVVFYSILTKKYCINTAQFVKKYITCARFKLGGCFQNYLKFIWDVCHAKIKKPNRIAQAFFKLN